MNKVKGVSSSNDKNEKGWFITLIYETIRVMKTVNFPYLAMALGLFLLLVIMRGSQTGIDDETALPLLTLLIINEGGFILTAVGAYIGIRQLIRSETPLKQQLLYTITTLLCALLVIQFSLLGIQLWPL